MKSLILSVAALFLIVGCKKPDFTESPKIEFVETTQQVLEDKSAAQIKITILFEDADGDLGDSLNTEEQEEPFNYYYSTYRLENGKDSVIEKDSSLFARFLDTDDKIPVSGFLDYSITYENVGDEILVNEGDSIFYTVRIADRAGNLSNEIITDTVVAYITD